MNLTNIPIDILNFHILKFAFGKCDKCEKDCHFKELVSDCKIFKYKNVFQDDYDFDEEIERFSLICKNCVKCYKSYNGRFIINLEVNRYKWIDNIKF